MKFSYMLPRNTKAKALNMVLNSNDRYDRHYRAKVAKKLRDLARCQESGRVFDPYTVDRPCRVIAHIYPPTKQDMDPPNVWPTVKPLIDGLTDAGVWNDDNGRVVAETSGSPPRMRVILVKVQTTYALARITPAHAGNTIGPPERGIGP